jgi:hypothetical protein
LHGALREPRAFGDLPEAEPCPGSLQGVSPEIKEDEDRGRLPIVAYQIGHQGVDDILIYSSRRIVPKTPPSQMWQ